MKKLCIGIIAGTKTDTQFGIKYVQSQGLDAQGVWLSDSPQAQTRLQALDADKLNQMVIDKANELVEKGADGVVIYCNSLSGAINENLVRSQCKVPIVNPLDVYRELNTRYRNYGLLAANCQSCANIERTILAFNSTAKVIGVGNLQIVEDVEAGLPAEQIIQSHALGDLMQTLAKSGIQILILGCTHFDYFFDELDALAKDVKLFLPSQRMLEMIRQQLA
ncbi:aspartate/glutamate racemase family protein [Aliikangiella sp. IMCC44632]